MINRTMFWSGAVLVLLNVASAVLNAVIGNYVVAGVNVALAVYLAAQMRHFA